MVLEAGQAVIQEALMMVEIHMAQVELLMEVVLRVVEVLMAVEVEWAVGVETVVAEAERVVERVVEIQTAEEEG